MPKTAIPFAMHDATEQNQGEIFTNWSQGHRTVALWQRGFPYTTDRSSNQGLILKTMLLTGFRSILAACQLAAKRRYQSGALGQTIKPASQQLFSSWILEVCNSDGFFLS